MLGNVLLMTPSIPPSHLSANAVERTRIFEVERLTQHLLLDHVISRNREREIEKVIEDFLF